MINCCKHDKTRYIDTLVLWVCSRCGRVNIGNKFLRQSSVWCGMERSKKIKDKAARILLDLNSEELNKLI